MISKVSSVLVLKFWQLLQLKYFFTSSFECVNVCFILQTGSNCGRNFGMVWIWPFPFYSLGGHLWVDAYPTPCPAPTLAGVWLLNPDGLLSTWFHLHAADLSHRTTLIRDYIMNFPLRPRAQPSKRKLNCDSVKGAGISTVSGCTCAARIPISLVDGLVLFRSTESSLKYHFRRQRCSANRIVR